MIYLSDNSLNSYCKWIVRIRYFSFRNKRKIFVCFYWIFGWM